eukprot:Selendium_serpulae@DN4750_c0_g1_i2.p1
MPPKEKDDKETKSHVVTTLKTQPCSYSEFTMYPGRGIRYIQKDSKNFLFISSKCKSLHLQRVKPARLRWTQEWRRANKKGRARGDAQKRRARKAP